MPVELRYDNNQSADDPCLASVAYSADISLLGTCIFGLFGVTYHNLRMTRDFFRAIKDEIYYIFCWTEGDDDTLSLPTTDQALLQMTESQVQSGEAPLPPPPPPTGKRAPLAEHDGGPVPGPATVTTHIGTRINARLGVIKAQLNNGAMPSALEPNAVSGSSMPPKSHPLAPKLAEQRDEYTRKVLEYATKRVMNMPGIEKQQFLESFMSEIEGDSRWEDDEDEEEGDEFCSEIYDSAMSVEDLDARLKKAKAKFEEALGRQESRVAQETNATAPPAAEAEIEVAPHSASPFSEELDTLHKFFVPGSARPASLDNAAVISLLETTCGEVSADAVEYLAAPFEPAGLPESTEAEKVAALMAFMPKLEEAIAAQKAAAKKAAQEKAAQESEEEKEKREMNEQIAANVDGLWGTYDVDRSGKLEKEEAKKFVIGLNGAEDLESIGGEEAFEEVFLTLDLDGSGDLTKDEIVSLVKKLMGVE
ncbi:hypothetical protein TrLO_g1256 [Triparma laevis f. longispina]|uniref:EF-hand domain-containing protein n=1 Tax=Triparma laevis f. longispina TaxID=1714387 RepID=A0A9W7AII9_9STRA|nr:hypothetical protein TrLO_g1256 [Triparma laevis f. longispina]